MSNKVALTCYGNSKFSTEDIPIESVLLRAVKSMFENNQNLSQKDVETVLVSTNSDSKYLGSVLSELAGIEPKISHTVESLCNSGTNAIVSAYSYIASGLVDVALVVGAERFDSPGNILEWDSARGEYKHPIFWGSIFTKAYKRRFNLKNEDLAIVSVKNHKNAKYNPFAISDKEYTVEDVIKSKELTEDLRVLDCSRPCTGGAAIILTSEKFAKKFTDLPIWIKGIGQKTIAAGFTKNPDFTSMISTKEAALQSFDMAKTSPEKIDVAEVHDAFAVCEPLAIEDVGIAKKGDGINFVKELFETDDKIINPRGGLIGTGHPLGATGIAQTIEIVQQLQGNAGKRQIEKAKTGLVHNMSAAATSSTVLILES